ncbi:MAG TPA: hypothetical protein VMY98_07950 [Anaerolineae bacterium]|nr:hypothetical protein [Anaerolineae bacterium]
MLNVHLLVLSVVIATMYAAVSCLIWGQGSRDLRIYWMAALAGFGAGQLLATAFSWHDVAQVGELHLLSASVVSWLSIALAKQLKL